MKLPQRERYNNRVIYLATRRLELLVLGLLIALGMFLVIFLLPTHLFQNPLRFRRHWPHR